MRRFIPFICFFFAICVFVQVRFLEKMGVANFSSGSSSSYAGGLQSPPPYPDPQATPPPGPTPAPAPTPMPALQPSPSTYVQPPAGTPNAWYSIPKNLGVNIRSGKHARFLWDSKRARLVIAGGDRDGSDAGQPDLQAIDPVTGAQTMVAPTCPKAPDYMPDWPDNVAFDYDSKRDRYVMLRGYYFGWETMKGTTACGRTDTNNVERGGTVGGHVLYYPGSAIFNPTTGKWEPPTWAPSPLGEGSDAAGPHFGAIDPVSDSMFLPKTMGTVQILHFATNMWTILNLGVDSKCGACGDPRRGRLADTVIGFANPVVDVQKRFLYLLSIGGSDRKHAAGLVKVNIDNPSIANQTMIDMPKDWIVIPSADQGGAHEYLMTFDPVNRVILHPWGDESGFIKHLYIYHVDTNVWETREVPDRTVSGNVIGFEKTTNSMVLWGRSATHDQTKYVTWRYKYVP